MIRIELVGANELDGLHFVIPAWTSVWRIPVFTPATAPRQHPATLRYWTYRLDDDPTPAGIFPARLQPTDTERAQP